MKYQIIKLERRNNSVNGNPKYEIYWLDENDYLQHSVTVSDAMFCYGITNDIYHESKPQVWAEMTFTPSGKIESFKVTNKMWEEAE